MAVQFIIITQNGHCLSNLIALVNGPTHLIISLIAPLLGTVWVLFFTEWITLGSRLCTLTCVLLRLRLGTAGSGCRSESMLGVCDLIRLNVSYTKGVGNKICIFFFSLFKYNLIICRLHSKTNQTNCVTVKTQGHIQEIPIIFYCLLFVDWCGGFSQPSFCWGVMKVTCLHEDGWLPPAP